MALDHLRTVSEDHQSSDGAEASSAQIDGRSIVDLTVDHCVHQPHHVRGQFRHRLRRLRVVARPVVAHAKFGGRLVQILHEVVVIFIVILQLAFQVGLVGAQIRVVFAVEVGGHGFHL